jgi:hypothetical protein
VPEGVAGLVVDRYVSATTGATVSDRTPRTAVARGHLFAARVAGAAGEFVMAVDNASGGQQRPSSTRRVGVVLP